MHSAESDEPPCVGVKVTLARGGCERRRHTVLLATQTRVGLRVVGGALL